MLLKGGCCCRELAFSIMLHYIIYLFIYYYYYYYCYYIIRDFKIQRCTGNKNVTYKCNCVLSVFQDYYSYPPS